MKKNQFAGVSNAKQAGQIDFEFSSTEIYLERKHSIELDSSLVYRVNLKRSRR